MGLPGARTSRRIRHLCLPLLFGCVLAGVAPDGAAATDRGFLLTATARNFATYFPGELANGYFSTFTSPRGTEGNLSYMAGFMDRSAGDIARPAAIPGWTGVDYRAGRSGAWMNDAPLTASTFQDYRQVLDLRGGVLTTRYRYVDGGRATGVAVVTLVSEAAPHLAVQRFSVTPAFSGTVELSFPLVLWAPYQPRLSLAELPGDTGLAGDRLRQALVAHGLSLVARAPATPDRAALWYHGDTRVLAARGDATSLTLAVDGKASGSPQMGEALALRLPAGVHPLVVRVDRTRHRLALDLRIAVRKGTRYEFTKYVTVSREGWGGNADADLALAVAARARGFAAALAEQRAAWAGLWQSDIRIDGDPRAQLIVHADLYALIANVAPDAAWGVGACGLTTGYAGHVFWDSDSWILPSLLLLHPRRARTLVRFRDRTLPAALQRARVAGFAGAKYPWEADPQDGSEQILRAAERLSEGEIHVDADVAVAQWQYWLATHDRAWLRTDGWPVLRAVAEFWASRVVPDAATGRYRIRDVVSVMEPYAHVDDDTFTNAMAARALRAATAAAKVLGVAADPRWAEIARRLDIPFSAADRRHRVFASGIPVDPTRGNDLALLSFPSVDLAMTGTVRRNDYAMASLPYRSGRTPTTMGLAPQVIAAAALGDTDAASRWLARDLAPDMLKPPFDVRTETTRNNVGYFLTGSAGVVQALVFGLTGLRVRPAGLVAAYAPVLPAGWKSLTLTNVTFRGKRYDIDVARDARGVPYLRRRPR